MIVHPTIYKYDTKGNCRVWRMEIDGAKYRTVAGIEGGSLVESKWTTAKGKNVGRANETSPEEQAELEVASKYENKLSREYSETKEAAKSGAHFFKPMLAQPYKGLPLWQDLYVQPKLDGMRCIATKDGLFSRQGKPILGCPHIFEALEAAFKKDPMLIIDGELYNHHLKDDFPRLMSLCKKQDPTDEQLAESAELVEYYVYDCPSKADFKFSTRMVFLSQALQDAGINTVDDYGPIVPTATLKITSDDPVKFFNDFHGKCVAAGHEGSMLRLDKPYEQKRSKHLLKRKDFLDDEFEVVRLVEGEGNWSGAVKSVLCRAKNGKEFGSGVKGSREYAESLMGRDFSTAKVRYFELTPDGVPRFGICLELYEGERDD